MTMWTKSRALSWALISLLATADSFLVPRHHSVRPSLLLSFKDNKNLSASEKERRDEDKRRKERKEDVVIGKTSAIPQAKDYSIDAKATEEEWMRQASNVEQEVYRKTEEGLEMLKLLRVEEASVAFDKVFELRPDAYLWQAGIAKFYLDEIQSAADIFARNVELYETKFGEPATEERIWRDACELKLRSETKKGDESVAIAQVPERDDDEEPLPTESRKVLRIARELFAASLEGNHSDEVLARAKLRAICGAYEGQQQPIIDRKLWRLTAWFYLGLHYDVIGEKEESKECMKMAVKACSGNANDVIHALPPIHMARRDLFDDEEFEEEHEEMAMASVRQDANNRGTRMDPVVIESIRTSISKMKIAEIQTALKARGLKWHDSKEALAKKLFRSLLEDSGLDA